MKKILSCKFLLLLAIFGLHAQTESNLIQTESGLQVKIHQEGIGPFPKPGDMITAHYTGKLLDGSVFDSSVKRGTPFSFEIGTGQVIKGWDEGFQLLKRGAKASFIIPADLAYGDRGMGSIPPNSVLIFDVELIEIEQAIALETFNVKGKDTIKTTSGLKYILVKDGTGKKAEADCKVEIHYTGYFEDGRIFDSTHKKGQTFKVLLGNRNLIPGLEEALMLMSEGAMYRVIVPPELGLAKMNQGKSLGDGDLIFDVEMISVSEKIEVEEYNVEGKRLYNHESGLKYFIISEKNGKRAKSGDFVEMHYTGYLEDGSIFDSSVKRGEVFTFKLGIGQVIKGWDAGVQLMNEGDKFRFIIPPSLGYGDRKIGNIPSNSTLIFDVELIRIVE